MHTILIHSHEYEHIGTHMYACTHKVVHHNMSYICKKYLVKTPKQSSKVQKTGIRGKVLFVHVFCYAVRAWRLESAFMVHSGPSMPMAHRTSTGMCWVREETPLFKGEETEDRQEQWPAQSHAAGRWVWEDSDCSLRTPEPDLLLFIAQAHDKIPLSKTWTEIWDYKWSLICTFRVPLSLCYL